MDTKSTKDIARTNTARTNISPALSWRQKIAMRLLGKEMILGATVPFYQDNKAVWGDWSTEKAIAEGFKVSTYVYACIYRIMKAASSVPWVTIDTNTEEPIKGHPLTQLMKRPNNFMSGQDLIERITTHLYLGGNGILSKVRANNIAVELWPMDPDGIKPVASQRDFISRYEWNKGGYIKDYPVQDIVHVMFTDPGNVFWGMSPLQAGAKAVDTDVEAMNWNKVSLQNRAISDGVFSFKTPLTKDQWNQARDMIKEQHQGSSNARVPWVLGSDATWTPMSLSPVEMDWLKSREMTREDICAIFQVPPPMIGIYDKATLTNIETARIIFWLDTVIPYLEDLQSAFNLSITPEFGDNIELRYDTNNVQALRDVYARQVTIAKDLFTLGIPFDKINEKLKLGFKKVPGGNVGYLPSNLMPTDMVASQEVQTPLLPKELVEMEKYFKLEDSFQKKKLALRTEEQKVRYWKSFEKQRFNWYKKVELETKKLLLQEAQAIGGVYRSSGDKGVSNYLSGRKKIWEKVLKSTANGIVVEFSKQSYESVIPPGKSVEKFGKKEFDPYDPFMFDYVESYGASRATLITETSKDRANQILRVGLVEGQTVDDQAKNLQEVYTQDAEYRSMRMARTEVVSASNFGSLAGMEQTGFKMTKMWVSSRDDRVRETHDMVDGEEVPLDEPFSNDMMYPGDINGSAEEVIMCRCTMAYDVPMQEAPTGESLGNDTFNMNHEDFVNYWMENKVINSAEPGYFSSMSENYYGGDKGLKKLWQEKGFDAPPKIVNEKELSAFIKEQNRPEFYRGIAGDSAKKYTEAFKSGDYYPGLGMHGNGTYAAANGEEAHRIATVYGRIAEMEGGQVMRFSIDKSANIISDSKLWDWQKELDDVLRKKLADPNLDSITEAKLLSVRDAIGNNGRLATMKNVDAYYLSSGVDREGNYWIIQNRSKLIVQDTNVERYIPIE